MARLYVFAEGQTEQTFADTLLKSHLADHRVYMHNPILIAHARRKRAVHRGGGRNYVAMKNDIVRLLKQESGGDVFFTTMIDLYALHAGFPGREEAEKSRNDPHRQVGALENAWSHDIGDPRFIPHIQLHEFEAYLFADVSKFASFYERADQRVSELKKIADSVNTPELIDDGQHSAPSKRIASQFPDYIDAKTAVGPQIAERIGLTTIRSKCPHFDAWLQRLEQLGTG